MDETVPDEITVYNWNDYMDPDVLKDFEGETGIKTNETCFASNEKWLAKLRAGSSGYDVIIPSDYMVSILIQSELLQPVDLFYIPSFASIGEQFRAPEFALSMRPSEDELARSEGSSTSASLRPCTRRHGPGSGPPDGSAGSV